MAKNEAPEKEPSILLCAVVIALVSLVCILWVFQDVEISEEQEWEVYSNERLRYKCTFNGIAYNCEQKVLPPLPREPVKIEPQLVAT